MCFGTKQNVRKQQKLHFTFLSCSNHNFLINPILIPIEFHCTTPVESCLELTLILESITNEVARVARATVHHSDQPTHDLDQRTIYPMKPMCAIMVRLPRTL